MPLMVTTDAWYSSLENLKLLKNKKLGLLMGVAKNRQVAINGGKYTQVQNLEIPAQGLLVHLKEFGYVKVFCHTFKNEVDRYAHYVFAKPRWHDATDKNRI